MGLLGSYLYVKVGVGEGVVLVLFAFFSRASNTSHQLCVALFCPIWPHCWVKGGSQGKVASVAPPRKCLLPLNTCTCTRPFFLGLGWLASGLLQLPPITAKHGILFQQPQLIKPALHYDMVGLKWLVQSLLGLDLYTWFSVIFA